MYLLTAAQLEALNKGLDQSGGCCTEPAPDVYDTLQRSIRTRVEEALNIEHLARHVWLDTFKISRHDAHRPVVLRLHNAFIDDPESVQLVDSRGEPLDIEQVDTRLGLVYGTFPSGFVKVTYTAGFPVGAESRVLQHTPDWMQTIALAAARGWLLATSKGAIPKDVALGSLTSAVRHELSSRIYNRYDRPRAGVTWPYNSLRALPDTPADFVELGGVGW